MPRSPSSVIPPPLPPAEVRSIAGRGEVFLRRTGSVGTGTPVLLIHGWQATADLNFFPLYEPLGRRHPVIAADLRGHGRSTYPEEPFTIEDAADDNAALLDDLGIESAIVVGYSLGTAVTQMMVGRHPERVAGIVLVGGELAPRSRAHEALYNRVGGWQGTAQRLTAGRWAAHRIVDKAARENPTAEQLRGWLVTEMERGHVASLRAAGRSLARFDGRPIAAERSVPASVVVTRRDRLVRPARQDRLAQAWRASVVDLDANHDAPLAQPAAFVAATLDAVERVQTSALRNIERIAS